MKAFKRDQIILALILGPILENAFQVSIQAYEGISWLGRPIVMIILALLIITLSFSTAGIIKNKRAKISPSAGGEGTERNPVISLPFTITLGVLSVWAGIEALHWPVLVKQFPLTIAVISTPLVLITLYL